MGRYKKRNKLRRLQSKLLKNKVLSKLLGEYIIRIKNNKSSTLSKDVREYVCSKHITCITLQSDSVDTVSDLLPHLSTKVRYLT